MTRNGKTPEENLIHALFEDDMTSNHPTRLNAQQAARIAEQMRRQRQAAKQAEAVAKRKAQEGNKP